MANTVPMPKPAKVTRVKGDLVVKSLSDVQYSVSYDTSIGNSNSNYYFQLVVDNPSYDEDVPTSEKWLSVVSTQAQWASGAKNVTTTFSLGNTPEVYKEEGIYETYQGSDGVYLKTNFGPVPTTKALPGGVAGTKYVHYVTNVKVMTGLSYNDGTTTYNQTNETAVMPDDEYYVPQENAADTGGGISGAPGGTSTTSVTTTFIDKGVGIETNLRMVKSAFGSPRTRTVTQYDGRELRTVQQSVGATWRNGFLHTFEGNPAYDTFPHMYGFRFHYNPSSWTMNTQMTESIDPQNVMGSRPLNLPLMGGWAGIGLTVFVNRIIELTMTRDQLLAVSNWQADKSMAGEKGVPDSDPTYVSGSVFGGRGKAKPKFIPANDNATIPQKVDALLAYGTLADIEYLYKSVNGDGQKSYHRKYLGGASEDPLSMDGRDKSTRTADYGFLNAIPVRVWLGPNITFVGRITSVEIQHLLFTENMIPKYSQINLSIQRPLTWGSGVEESNNFWSSAGSGNGDLKSGILVPGSAAGGNTNPNGNGSGNGTGGNGT